MACEGGVSRGRDRKAALRLRRWTRMRCRGDDHHYQNVSTCFYQRYLSFFLVLPELEMDDALNADLRNEVVVEYYIGNAGYRNEDAARKGEEKGA